MTAKISLLVLAAALIVLLFLVPSAVFLIFSGILLAILLRACGAATARVTRLPETYALALFLLVLVALLVFGSAAVAPAISAQIDEISAAIPKGFASLKANIENYGWGKRLLGQDFTQMVRWPAATSMTTGFLSTTFGALGDLVIILFIGIYGAFDPSRYRCGMIKMLAPSIRETGAEVLDKSVGALRNWIIGQLIAMALIGVLTGLGLWLANVPLALLLGLIAALLAFIPNIGPVLGALPGVLIALPDGTEKVLLVLSIYVVVQALESYVITPLVQKQRVNLQPAFVIAVQIIFSALFGLLGLAVATPFAALAKTLTNELYVRRYLEKETKPSAEDRLDKGHAA